MSSFGSHHHLMNPQDSPYSVEISPGGESSDFDSLSEVDLESGGVTVLHSCSKKRRKRRRKKRKKKEGRDCRICHLPLENSNNNKEEDENSDEDKEEEVREEEEEEEEEEEYYGLPLKLGCSCKGDLGVAHSKCAETWFKIKGNLTCEICGAMAINVAGEQSNTESIASANSQTLATGQLQTQTEPRSAWHGRPVMNFLLAVMVFAFVVSWLFHFKVLK